MDYFVYVIGKKEDMVEPYTKCYIGVTKDLIRRWNSHKKSNYTVGEYIRTHNLTQDNMSVIFHGTEEECFNMENKLRPYPLMGLNEAVGGGGGFTSYTLERNEKISKAMKNRNMTWGDKVSISRKEKKIAAGSNNVRAKRWKLTDPIGNVYIVDGNLNKFCEDNKILAACLRTNLGTIIPPIKVGYGGFRALSDEHRHLRENTSGWSLEKIGELKLLS